MSAPSLFQYDLPPSRVSESSLEAFEKIRATVKRRDLEMCLSVAAYCERMGHEDVTGWELANYLGKRVTSVRPRL